MFRISGIRVSPKGDSLTHLIGTVPGPTGTPYEGGAFKIDITLPVGYPFEPPKMKFATKVWYVKDMSSTICRLFYVLYFRNRSNVRTTILYLYLFIWGIMEGHTNY
ncbi:Ubiquitin-conjugating enzyme E2 27 [Datura stramonium]|uniref:Ubiquitin-conjugating enzyme E2 27 n=1 Tax=Datura stramonium TaxID=4076 RepID=A0ABS8VIU0_DATST|nr:Ubiquitin-conjugating enzyme E2 27 [Datura stramonium]